MPGAFKVALLIETARGYGRGLLRGIVRYARLHGPWAFYVSPGDFEQAVPQMKQWGGTGIIARVETPKVAEALLATRLPVVALDLDDEQMAPACPLSRFSELSSDSAGAARLAAEHLLERGLRHYGFVGVGGRVWSDRRQAAFCRRVAEAGYEADVYTSPGRGRRHEWGRRHSRLTEWLAGRPLPVGLMACNDDCGRETLEACRAAGLQVPEQVAVVGVDNDELLCDLADPPLSSVALNTERAGFEAAALLDRLMTGQTKRPQRIVTEALHVVTRRSTDIVALDDPDVALAVRFILDHAAHPIRVLDVVREVSVSRRSLEMRFQRVAGRSIHDEIQRNRLERVKRLLGETDLRLPEIAESAGFGSASYLAQVFRRQTGLTPARYRRHVRSR